MTRYRAAVVGCGRMGSTIDDEVLGESSVLLPMSHAAGYTESPHTELVAACDTDEEKLRAFSKRWGVEALFSDVSQMMSDAAPDLVSVATPTAPRCETTLQVLAGGAKAIIVEKPIAETLSDGDRMVRACADARVPLAVNCSRRWDPRYFRVLELIEQGAIGEVRAIHALCPGGLSHMGSHLLDIVCFYAESEVKWCVGHIDSHQAALADADVSGCGYLVFANGVRAFVNMVDAGATSVELDVIGDSGRIRILQNAREFELWQRREDTRRPTLVRAPFPHPQRLQAPIMCAIEDLIECIETGGEPRCTGADGRHALEVALAIRESERLGNARVDLPLADRSLVMRSK
ncbi:MAG: Gfo/Idh/MocA family protein [Armatimonadota bacterium]